MWLSDRRAFLSLIVAGGLAACGFSPVYGPGGSGTALQGTVIADAPSDKRAFDLVERIEERLGPSDAPRFKLSYEITATPVGVAITTSNAVTRYNLTGSVAYTLRDAATDAVLTSGRVENFTSYSATGSTVAGLAAEEDASLRLIRILADQIVTQLLATSGQWVNR
jgi:LPS-assembly lipoprotein